MTGKLASAWQRGGVDAVVELLDGDERFKRTGLDARKLVGAASSNGPLSDTAVYRAMLATISESHPGMRLGDKDPRAIEYLGHLKRDFPDSIVVHVIRDPRDVLLSKKKAAWSSSYSTIRHLMAGRVQLRIGQQEGNRLFPGQYHEVHYEDLLENPEAELEKLCRKLNLEFDASMLTFGRNAANLVASDEIPWKKEVLGPLLRNNKDKWKTALSDREIALTELVCDAHFANGHYHRSGRVKNLPPLSRLAVHAEALTICGLDPVYRAYRRLFGARSSRRRRIALADNTAKSRSPRTLKSHAHDTLEAQVLRKERLSKTDWLGAFCFSTPGATEEKVRLLRSADARGNAS